jgi:hypothetical protein
VTPVAVLGVSDAVRVNGVVSDWHDFSLLGLLRA